MSTPKRHPRSRALRPAAEALDPRLLLSGMVSGVDVDGDTWTLRLIGPGTLRVTKQDDLAVDGDEQLGFPSPIDTIRIAGTDVRLSRLVGQVTQDPNGDGRVFFQNLRQTGGRDTPPLDPNQPVIDDAAIDDGVLAVDLPNFWLGSTATDLAAGTSPTIDIPDGVVTLRFGGVDSTFAVDGGTSPNANNRNDAFTVDLGLPATRGTSIIVDRVVAGAQPPAGQAGQPTQDTVNITVDGRINLFQANGIDFQGNGVDLETVTTGTNVTSGDLLSATTGQIGNFRVGGSATNLAVTVQAGQNVQFGNSFARVSNFSVGGETQNVQLTAPAGARNLFFGRGLDDVTIDTLVITHLQANRGAINSAVTAARGINRVLIGGDVVNTTVLSGTVQTPDGGQTAQGGGRMTVRIAGDVVDSIFAASVDPVVNGDPGLFGDLVTLRNGRMRINDIILPGGRIHAKVEGTIDNSNNLLVDPAAADQAFFADIVRVRPGPVVPPNVPEPPYPPGGGIAPNADRVVRGLRPNRTRRAPQAPPPDES